MAVNPLHPPKIPLSDEEFALLHELIYQHCGLRFDSQNKSLLESRLQSRLRHCQCASFRDYYLYLRYDRRREEELAECIDLVAVHETYFFREINQLQDFVRELLPEFMKKPNQPRTLRIWSAGCSTGEEPYSLAMLLLDEPSLRGWDINIIATDISPRVLQQARRGIYRESSFRVMDPNYLSRYFEPAPGGMKLLEPPRQPVTFLCLNLFDQHRQGLIWGMDFIFCRNVMIYFDAAAKQRVAELFYDKLNPGGSLLLGHAESLLNISTAFQLRHLSHDLVYQKPAAPSAASLAGQPKRTGS
ncbi:MAG: protein-glutamate O-methyltransferase CheR [Nitrospirae bacterium]|nr:protein-glutamate O-methyltransferase CheR [Nitrospirota bacterium]